MTCKMIVFIKFRALIFLIKLFKKANLLWSIKTKYGIKRKQVHLIIIAGTKS